MLSIGTNLMGLPVSLQHKKEFSDLRHLEAAIAKASQEPGDGVVVQLRIKARYRR